MNLSKKDKKQQKIYKLFINDYYPYVMLVKSYKGLKQYDKEVD